ncbi:MAG: CHC2 zinc finger domain-containing protein, partial [Clostridiales bacterium]|nr:CHC2 zinc finger domain-containing protein [Clostridiales bacterium]
MAIPESFLEELNARTDIVDLISGYVTLTKKGNRYWGLCPFHSEKTPSFSVSPERQMYYC